MEAGKGRRAKKCLEMRVGKSERAREGGGRRETAGMGQADRAGEEKFNLETQSSKLPKEVHTPCIHRRARRRREGGGRAGGWDDFSRGTKFHPVAAPGPNQLPLLILTPNANLVLLSYLSRQVKTHSQL